MNDAWKTCPKGTARPALNNAFDVLPRLVNFAFFTEVAGDGEDADQDVIKYACPDRASISLCALVCELSSEDAKPSLLRRSPLLCMPKVSKEDYDPHYYLHLMLICYHCFGGMIPLWSNSYTRFTLGMDIVYVYVYLYLRRDAGGRAELTANWVGVLWILDSGKWRSCWMVSAKRMAGNKKMRGVDWVASSRASTKVD